MPVPVRRPTSWAEVERAILVRIAGGAYAIDQRLPTCEQLAHELGVNKNTVSKAYRSLASRGYVHTSAGRGTFVARRPARHDLQWAAADVSGLLALVVQEAKLAGLDRHGFQRLVDQIASRYYDHTPLRVGYVECNRLEAAVLSRDLQVALAHPVEPLLLDEVMADPSAYLRRFDVLAVNVSHLVLVEQRLRQVARPGAAEIVALSQPPDPESLVQVARLRPATRLGIVCDLEGTLESLRGLVRGANPSLEVRGCLTGDRTGLRDLVDWSEVLLVSLSAQDTVVALGPHVPLIPVSFKVDERSVQYLAARIAAGLRRTHETGT